MPSISDRNLWRFFWSRSRNFYAGNFIIGIKNIHTVTLVTSVCVVGSLLFMQQVSTFRDLVRQKVHN